MTNDNISWKSIRAISWKTFYNQLYDYLHSGKEPKKMSKSGLWRFKKKAELFELLEDPTSSGEKSSLEIFFTTSVLPPEFSDIDSKILGKGEDKTYRVIDPEEKENTILAVYHSELAGGFRGVLAIYKKIAQQFLGITRKDVADVLGRLETKQLKRPTLARTLKPITEMTSPMDMLQADLMDFEHISKFNNGYVFLLNVIDTFSKFLWSIPLKNKSSEVVAYHIQNIIMSEGVPRVILTDNGSEFRNKDMDELSERWGFEMRHGNPYKSNSQGQIEKVNGTVRDMLHGYMNEHNTKQYVDKLPHLVYSYNTTAHSTTKYSPFMSHRKKNEMFNLDKVIKKNIMVASEKMIKKVEKALEKKKEKNQELKEGDTVRISTQSQIAVRKKGELVIKGKKHRNEIAGWSKETPKITEIIKRDDGTINYKLTGNRQRKAFVRSELQKINPDNLIKAGQQKKKDLSFGQGGFDVENHLNKIRGKESNITQEELEEKHKDDVIVSRPKRVRKQVDRGFFVS